MCLRFLKQEGLLKLDDVRVIYKFENLSFLSRSFKSRGVTSVEDFNNQVFVDICSIISLAWVHRGRAADTDRTISNVVSELILKLVGVK